MSQNLIPCFLTFCSTIEFNPYLPFEFLHTYIHTYIVTYINTYVFIYILIYSAEELQQSLLNHYERADLELSLPPPGRIGAMRNMPVVKAKGDLEVSIEDHEKHVITENEMYISYKVCIKVSTLLY